MVGGNSRVVCGCPYKDRFNKNIQCVYQLYNTQYPLWIFFPPRGDMTSTVHENDNTCSSNNEW